MYRNEWVNMWERFEMNVLNIYDCIQGTFDVVIENGSKPFGPRPEYMGII